MTGHLRYYLWRNRRNIMAMRPSQCW